MSLKISEMTPKVTTEDTDEVPLYDPGEPLPANQNKRATRASLRAGLAASADLTAHTGDASVHVTSAQNDALDSSSSPSAINPYLTQSAGDTRYMEAADPPNAHAASHASAGSDPVTPAAIGAALASHTHTLSQVTDAGTMAAEDDAPIDGSPYGRKNAAWGVVLEPADISSSTITPRTGAINFSGGSDGNVLTVQADGSLAIEALPAGGAVALNDITDVTIDTPADNEVLAYNTGTAEWLNQTPAEAGLATSAQGALADTALQPSDIASGAITARANAINFSGGSDGNVLTVQADGSLAIEALPAGGAVALNDITDVTIDTPADNEVLAYNTGTAEWLNQTPAEAGLATSAQGALADTALQPGDVDDVPVDAATTAPISSNWAYDHENAADPHPGYLTPAEANAAYEAIDATILRQADVDDIPVDAATTVPISSNWAYDHAALTQAHGISAFGATLVDDADAAAARTTLGLGSAATQDTTAFATAAQGALADTALQPSDIASGTITPRTGAIDFSGGSDGHVLTVQADGSLAVEVLPAGGAVALNDITDVTITTPADNEVLAYNTGTAEWLNQTPAEAGLATAAQGALADTALQPGDVDDVPVDTATTVPISSNWAFDHENAADPHPGYLTQTEGDALYEGLDATILRQSDVDDTPVDTATTVPISSNWAFDHAALTTAHGISSFGATLVDDANQATAQATLGLVPGTNIQAYDAGLQSIAGLTTAANQMIYTTALDTYALTNLTAFARTILDDADAAAVRTTIDAMQHLLDDLTPGLAGDLDANNRVIDEVKAIGFNSLFDNGTKTASFAIDFTTNGQYQKVTLGASTTLSSFTFPGLGVFTLQILQDATGSRTLTLPTGLWPGGTAGTLSTAANAKDTLHIMWDGTSRHYKLEMGWA